jgi:signal peptidase I
MSADVDELSVDSETRPVKQPAPPKSPLATLVEWVVVVAIAISSALLVKSYVVAQFQVEGTSMMPTLHQGDRVLVNRLSYKFGDPGRGDVVVLHSDAGAFNERDLIKRVIGLPGEQIDIRNCRVFVDGRMLEEPYLDPVTCTDSGSSLVFPFTVPDGDVFVLGDNRSPNGSMDSRSIGPVDENDVLGRAFVVMWPKADWQWL